MTLEEKEKAIDALKISAPIKAVTQEEFNTYIQIINQVMDWLEQEPMTGRWIPLSNDIIKNGVDVILKAIDGDIYKTHLSITGTLPDGDEEELKNIEAFMIIKKEE